MKKKKIVIIAVIILVIAVAAIVAFKTLGAPKDQGVAVTVGKAAVMDIEQVVSIKGIIEGSDLAEISSVKDLEVKSIAVKEGDKVNKGQILATLDSESIKADYEKAVNTLEQSKFSYDTNQKLFAEGAVSMDELQKSRVAYENDRINVNSFNKMDEAVIKSPIKGTVTRINTSLGRAANDTKDKAPMFVIEDLANLEMNVKVSEYDISDIKLGQSVEISAEVLGDTVVTGLVSKISPTGEAKDVNSKEMVVPVTIKVNQAASGLIAGVSAKAKIMIQNKEGALTVPIDALLQDPETEEYSIFKIVKKSLVKIPVAVGIEGNLDVEIITDKIKAGDNVVLGPTFDLKNGTVITATPRQ